LHKDLINKIADTLKSKGLKKSLVREQILCLILNSESPVSALDILQYFKSQRIDVNKTSVYRELLTLQEEEIITEYDFLDGKKRYEYNKNSHHHHTVCTKCNTVACVEINHDLDFIESQIEKQNDFKINKHYLEFFGICKKCKI